MLPVNYVCISMHEEPSISIRWRAHYDAPLWQHVTRPSRTRPDFKAFARTRTRGTEEERKENGKRKERERERDARSRGSTSSCWREEQRRPNTVRELTLVENKGNAGTRTGHGWWQNGPWLTRLLFSHSISFPAVLHRGKLSAILHDHFACHACSVLLTAGC